MKIAIAGTHGTGKTTFAKALAAKVDLNYIPDIVREEAAQKGFVVNENTPPEVQLWLVMRQWELEKNTKEPWVADKSLFDYLIYGDFVIKDGKIKEVIKELVIRNANYDFIFYLPIEFAMEQDGLRSQSEDFRKEIDKRYKKFLESDGMKYITLSGSVEDRVNQAIKYLKN